MVKFATLTSLARDLNKNRGSDWPTVSVDLLIEFANLCDCFSVLYRRDSQYYIRQLADLF